MKKLFDKKRVKKIRPQDDDSALAVIQGDEFSLKYNQTSWYSPRGRICRVQFLAYFSMWWLVVAVMLAIFILLVGFNPFNPSATASLGFFGNFLVFLMCLVSLYALGVLHSRRLHDLNISSFFVLLLIIPIINIVLSVILAIKKGEKESNRFGRPAKPFTNIQHKFSMVTPLTYLLSVAFLVLLSSAEFGKQAEIQSGLVDVNNTVVLEKTIIDTQSLVPDVNENNQPSDGQQEDNKSEQDSRVATDSVEKEVAIQPVINLPISDESWQDVSIHTDPAFDSIDGFLNKEGEKVFTE